MNALDFPVPLATSSAPKKFIVAIDPAAPPPGLEGAVAAIGNFDGVHPGHVAVIERAKALARKLQRPCVVLTFEPHPTDYFKGPGTIFRLTPCRAKAKLLERLGVDGMIVLTFDKTLASLPAGDFITDILLRRLGIHAVVAGYDFHFGARRSGTPAYLKAAGERLGLTIEIVEQVPSQTPGEAASSTATRGALEAGDAALAMRLLGRPFSIMGEVIEGQKLGRTLGFPTANLLPDPSCRLRHGVYAVRVKLGEATYDGVASYGRRPTFDNGPAILEAFLFDFSGDLYGETAEVFFIGWIRAEAKFNSPEALVHQMKQDAASAKLILAHQPQTDPRAAC